MNGTRLTLLLVFILVVGQACSPTEERGPRGRLPAVVNGTTVIRARPIQPRLIEFGFDVPSAGFIASHISEMERQPFDGLVFRPGPPDVFRQAFDVQPWSAKDLHLGTLRKISWGRFTDNFLHLYGASFSSMDWFDDEHWRTITSNMRMYRRAVEACGCVGVAFDPEHYGGLNPWAYTPSAYGQRSFENVQDEVRARGAEFIGALQRSNGRLTLLFFFLLGHVRHDLARGISLPDSRYALLPAFLDGILDAAKPGLTIVDGNEDAYQYVDTNQFFGGAAGIRAAAELLLPENRAAYRARVQVGSALFVDRVLTENPDDYRRMQWDHNVYMALATSDRFVWCYSQEPDWWKGDLFRGSGAGIRHARARLDALEPLGYDLAAASGESSVMELPSVSVTVSSTVHPRIIVQVRGSDILRVDLYRSGEPIGSDERAPYRFDLNDLTGTATFIARAFDAQGGHGTSAPIRISVP